MLKAILQSQMLITPGFNTQKDDFIYLFNGRCSKSFYMIRKKLYLLYYYNCRIMVMESRRHTTIMRESFVWLHTPVSFIKLNREKEGL